MDRRSGRRPRVPGLLQPTARAVGVPLRLALVPVAAQGRRARFASLRRLLAEDQAEFDEQIKNLTKLLVDALNDEAIQAELPSKVKDEKSTGKLTRWLAQVNQPKAAQHIEFLEKLQAIRSNCAAHRRGSD